MEKNPDAVAGLQDFNLLLGYPPAVSTCIECSGGGPFNTLIALLLVTIPLSGAEGLGQVVV